MAAQDEPYTGPSSPWLSWVRPWWYYVEVGLCFTGVCVFFVTYGILQEQIMTQEYPSGGHFPSSIALVLANRSLAICMLPLLILWRKEPLFWTGFWWCAIPAVTLVISSWCQHESLRYVSFPTQVVFKSSKIVPTMTLGYVLLGKVYLMQDYAMAMVVTAAVICFSLSMEKPHASEEARETMSFGVAMMALFLVCDALTSNSEKKVYNKYPGISPVQMFFSVAIFSWVYSLISVHATDGFVPVVDFLMANPSCCMHVAGLSVAACCGQVLIFYIVKEHGPVIFAVMMTVRQMISIVTSALIFHHSIGWFAAISASVVFGTIFCQSYLTHRRHMSEKEAKRLEGDKEKQQDYGSTEPLKP
jgi:adenosine 3'-phospho 5'-phosphosulfate transporter B2